MEPITIGILAFAAYKALKSKTPAAVAAQATADAIESYSQQIMTHGMIAVDKITGELKSRMSALGMTPSGTGFTNGYMAFIDGPIPPFTVEILGQLSGEWNFYLHQIDLANADGIFNAYESNKIVESAQRLADYLIKAGIKKDAYKANADSNQSGILAYGQAQAAASAARAQQTIVGQMQILRNKLQAKIDYYNGQISQGLAYATDMAYQSILKEIRDLTIYKNWDDSLRKLMKYWGITEKIVGMYPSDFSVVLSLDPGTFPMPASDGALATPQQRLDRATELMKAWEQYTIWLNSQEAPPMDWTKAAQILQALVGINVTYSIAEATNEINMGAGYSSQWDPQPGSQTKVWGGRFESLGPKFPTPPYQGMGNPTLNPKPIKGTMPFSFDLMDMDSMIASGSMQQFGRDSALAQLRANPYV